MTGAKAVERDRGSGTVLAAALGMALMIVMAGLLLIAQAATLASRAAAAADLAALAGADAARGITSGDPCGIAAATAHRNNATVSSCVMAGGDTLEIRTELRERTIVGTATGRSRAGPPP
jgi:secretion/DNA translocation related TadE-like protein